MIEGFIEVTPILRCGVYALVREGVVVYVGQSKKMLSRIEAHRSQWARSHKAPDWLPIKGILFDQIFIRPCRVEDLDLLERQLIDLYKPRYNVKLKAPTPTKTELVIRLPNGTTIPFNNQPGGMNHVPRDGVFERRI